MLHILRPLAWFWGWNDSLIRFRIHFVFQSTLMRSLQYAASCFAVLADYTRVSTCVCFWLRNCCSPNPCTSKQGMEFQVTYFVPEEFHSPKHSNYLCDSRDHENWTLLIYNRFNSFFQLTVNWGRSGKYENMMLSYLLWIKTNFGEIERKSSLLWEQIKAKRLCLSPVFIHSTCTDRGCNNKHYYSKIF